MNDPNSKSQASADTERVYDLEERTAAFGEQIIRFARKIQLDAVTRSIVDQLVRSGTSIGANYLEAEDGQSKKDFRHKISICRKESKEVRHWLRMITAAVPDVRDDARRLWQEAKELNLIFGAILRSKPQADSD
jgi:four helix bundle protein